MLFAAQAADDGDGLAKVPADALADLNHKLLHFRGISIAVAGILVALALEFLPGKILDAVPEQGRILILRHWLRCLEQIPGNGILHGSLGIGAGVTIHGQTAVGILEVFRGIFGQLAPDAVYRAFVVAQVGQQMLFLFHCHGGTSHRAPHPGRQDGSQGQEQDCCFDVLAHKDLLLCCAPVRAGAFVVIESFMVVFDRMATS